MQVIFEWDTFMEDIAELYPNDSVSTNNNYVSQIEIHNRALSGFLRKTKQGQNIDGLIGMLDSKSTFHWEFNNQSENNMSYVVFVKGRGSLEINNTHYSLSRYFFVNPDCNPITMTLEANQEVSIVIMRVEYQAVSALLSDLKIEHDFFLKPHYLSSQIELMMRALKSYGIDFISIIETQHKLFQLFLAVFDEGKNIAKRKISAESFSSLQKVVDILIKNYSYPEKPNIQKLAASINISPSKLKSDFKLVYQESIYSYYLKRKLEYAAELLASQKYTVSQVAIKVGYQVQATKFIQIFRKYYGMTPKQYQISKQNKINV